MSELMLQTSEPSGMMGFFNFSSFRDAMEMAKMIANSNFCPKSFSGKPENILLAIQFGNELGLKPLQSLQNVAVVAGKPSIYGDAALAICKSSPDYEYIKEWREETKEGITAYCESKRKGEPALITKFSVSDAKKANLWGTQGPWTEYPDRMLQFRARGFNLRDNFPHVLKGFITVEEARDYPAPKNLQSSVVPIKQPPERISDNKILEIQSLMKELGTTSEDLIKMISAAAGKRVDGLDFYNPETINEKQGEFILKVLLDEEKSREAQTMEGQSDE